MTDETTEPTTEPEPTITATYIKLFKLALPFLIALVPGGAALNQSMEADDSADAALGKIGKAWALIEVPVNELIKREDAARKERLELTKELALLRGALSAKGIVPTSRAEVADGPKPVMVPAQKKEPPKDKGKDAPKKPKPKPDPKPKKPPIKKLPTTLTC